jgi:hypothetical protein
MKTRGFIVIVFGLTLLLSVQFVNTSAAAEPNNRYSARLILPAGGQTLYPGQIVRVQWASTYPNVNVEACETEIWISYDGGRTYDRFINPPLLPKAQSFNWTVPNTPTNQAVFDIRFGCEQNYPESYAPQLGSMFKISSVVGDN